MNFPDDWRDVMANYFTEKYISIYEMQRAEPSWRMVEDRF
jgi:hypothetical protein